MENGTTVTPGETGTQRNRTLFSHFRCPSIEGLPRDDGLESPLKK